MTPLTRSSLLALAVAGLLAAPAGAAVLPPSLTTDTNYAFSGVVEYDFTVTDGVSADQAYAAAADPARGRTYAVGMGTRSGDADLAVVARTAAGALDPGFAGDGSYALDVEAGSDDVATSVAVLGDGRLRVLGSTESPDDADLVVVGLLPDGELDPDFGDAGIVELELTQSDDEPTRIAAAPDGRLALTGAADGEPFVAVLEADGQRAGFGTAGVRLLEIDPGASDARGVGVAWRAAGPAVLVEHRDAGNDRWVALRALAADGDDDTGFSGDGALPLLVTGDDVRGGGLLAYGGRLWATGSTDVEGDFDAYLARVDGDGANAQIRRFDLRGSVFPPTQKVASHANDLTVVPGEPDTLVVGGGVNITGGGSEIAAAAFNGLDGDLASLASAELVIPVEGQGHAVGVAGGAGGSVALAAFMYDRSVESGTGTDDLSIGMSRLLVDAEKRCDLALTVTNPLELTLRGLAPSPVALRATNHGERACGGAITVPAPYSIAPATLETGKLDPGASVDLAAAVSYAGTRPVQDILAFTLGAPADPALTDNTARLRVAFAFCDLALVRVGGPKALGREGARRYGFTVRNRGTAACNDVGIAVGSAGYRVGRPEPYTVPAGSSVTDEVWVAARRKRVQSGLRATVGFMAVTAEDLDPANNLAVATPMIVRTGDTNAFRPENGRSFSGSARPGRAPGVKRRQLRIARVEIAIQALGGDSCRWLSTAAGGLRIVPAGFAGACDAPVWVQVRGREDWRLRLAEKLPKGRYQLLSRAVLRNGVAEGAFSAKDRNRVKFTVR